VRKVIQQIMDLYLIIIKNSQKYTEIPSYPSQDDYCQENKQIQMLARMQEERNPYMLLVGM
jgi:hypothetical protein